MSKVYLIGGGDYRNDELDKLNRTILKDFSLNKTFLIIPFATKEEKRIGYVSTIRNSFSKIKKNIKFDVLSEKNTKNERIEKISDSGLIFFTGGFPEVLIDKLYGGEILNLLKSYKGILVGYSAGALAFSDLCFVSRDEDYQRSKIIKGLGIVNFTTSVHYEDKDDNEISFFSRYRKIYAIPNNSAIIVKDKEISFFGDILLFDERSKELMSNRDCSDVSVIDQ